MSMQTTFTALSGSSTAPITGSWFDVSGYKYFTCQARSSVINGELYCYITSAELQPGVPDTSAAYEYTPFVNTNAPSWTALATPIVRPLTAKYMQLRWVKQPAASYGAGEVQAVVSLGGG